MVVPMILPLFLPAQMKGGGFTCRKGEAVGKSSPARRTPFYWGMSGEETHPQALLS